MQIFAAIAFGTILSIALAVAACIAIDHDNFVDLDGKQ